MLHANLNHDGLVVGILNSQISNHLLYLVLYYILIQSLHNPYFSVCWLIHWFLNNTVEMFPIDRWEAEASADLV